MNDSRVTLILYCFTFALWIFNLYLYMIYLQEESVKFSYEICKEAVQKDII